MKSYDFRLPVLLLLASLIVGKDLFFRQGHSVPERVYFHIQASQNTQAEGLKGQRREWQLVPMEQAETLTQKHVLPPDVALFFDQPLPLNFCTMNALEQLPGVGPRLAKKIFTSRKEQGFFTGPEDLVRVHGIGAKTRDRLAPYLSFSQSEQTP